MALNKKRIAKRPIGPAMQWTKRGGQQSDAQNIARNINIDLDAYRTAEPKQPDSKKHRPSKQTGNPVALKKQRGTTEQQARSNNSTQNSTSLSQDRAASSEDSQETAWDYYSGGAYSNHYAQWAQNGKQHQPGTHPSNAAVWSSHGQSTPQHRTAAKTGESGVASQHFGDNGVIRTNRGTRSSPLSFRQYILPFAVVVALVVLGIFASLG